MTQSKQFTIQFRNNIDELQRSQAEQRDARTMTTPFDTPIGARIYAVDIIPAWHTDQLRVALTLLGGTQEMRVMANDATTRQLAQAYAANATNPTVQVQL